MDGVRWIRRGVRRISLFVGRQKVAGYEGRRRTRITHHAMRGRHDYGPMSHWARRCSACGGFTAFPTVSLKRDRRDELRIAHTDFIVHFNEKGGTILLVNAIFIFVDAIMR